MKTTFDLPVRAFLVSILDERTGEERGDIIVLDKNRLQAAQMVGQSSKELIERIYNKEGYKVLDIGKADKLTLVLRLDNIYAELTSRDQHTPFGHVWSLTGGGSR